MKNKRLIMIIVGVAVITLFSVTAFAMDNNEAYESLKKSLITREHEVDNGTINGTVAISDNNETILALKFMGKIDYESEEASGTLEMTIDDLTRNAEFYKENDLVYFIDKDNDLYYQATELEGKHHRNNHMNKDFKMSKQEDAFFDFMMGDIKDAVQLVSDEEGIKTYSIELSENEIPIPLQFMITKAHEHRDDSNEKNKDECNVIHNLPFFEGVKDEVFALKNLKDDIKFNEIKMTFQINENNQVIGHKFDLLVSGTDDNKELHNISIKGALQMTDMGTTVIEKLDLSNQEIQIISHNE